MNTTPTEHATTFERASDREVVVTRTFDAPARLVFAAWTQPARMKQWWVPKSVGLTLDGCEMDVRIGGSYRLVFTLGEREPMAFFGTYREVIPDARLVWTNEEADDGGAVTSVTFEEDGARTRLTMRELHPSKEAADQWLAQGMEACTRETYAQLDALLVTMRASAD